MAYVQAIGVYLPQLRLSRAAMGKALGWLTPGAGSGGKGRRTVAYWDEDSLTMAVAAARRTLAASRDSNVDTLYFASTTPPYAEPQNAAFARAALGLSQNVRTHDAHGSARAGLLALHQSLEAGERTLITAGDVPVAMPGSVAEGRSGDGGAAVLTDDESGMLRYLGGASLSAPFTDRYRASDQPYPQEWEERWVREVGYMELVHDAIVRALENAQTAAQDIDHFVMPCSMPGVSRALAAKIGLGRAKEASPLAEGCGDTGVAHPLIMLGHALEGIEPGQKVLVAQFGQGATALVFEAAESVTAPSPTVSAQLQQGIDEENYMKLLAFRGKVDWDRGLRGRYFVNEALSTSWRNADALLGFVGGRCRDTGRVQFPPSRLAVGEGFHLDTQEPIRLADEPARIATFTADRLAFSPSPPNCYGLLDFDCGARVLMEFTDPDAASLELGDSVEFTFRIKEVDPTTGYRRYFWKAIAAERTI